MVVLRRGLPRVRGGEQWPPAGSPEPAFAGAATASATTQLPPAAVSPAAAPRMSTPAPATVAVRRGLPRVAGGSPWPPEGFVPEGAVPGDGASLAGGIETPAAVAVAPAEAAASVALRRGLPRLQGGAPWPPADAVATIATVAPAEVVVGAGAVDAGATGQPAAAAEPGDTALTPASDLSVPLPMRRSAWAGVADGLQRAARRAAAGETAGRPRPTWPQVITGLFAAAALCMVALSVVFAVRWVLSTTPGADFLAAYPGEYHLPEWAVPGFPAWVQWQHFLNMFFMLLIIRSGLRVRYERRPEAYWTARWNPNRKISLALWFHLSLDILWLLNGVAFVVLLFVTGHWVRIVPTSWEVFPNALSAALQYVSLDWPTENGWVNYNSLQQLAYFATVFLAAPLAAITGVRMSGVWPKNATRLNTLYPLEVARAIHFPVMLYFVAFIVMHVSLVFATGALRNLNHMYGGQDVVNWAGFWIFLGTVVVLVIGWLLARPLVIAPIARLFGSVSSR